MFKEYDENEFDETHYLYSFKEVDQCNEQEEFLPGVESSEEYDTVHKINQVVWKEAPITRHQKGWRAEQQSDRESVNEYIKSKTGYDTFEKLAAVDFDKADELQYKSRELQAAKRKSSYA